MFRYHCSGAFVDVLKVFLQERVSARIVEQIVDVPVLLVVEEIVEVCDLSWSASNIAQLRIVDVPVLHPGAYC